MADHAQRVTPAMEARKQARSLTVADFGPMVLGHPRADGPHDAHAGSSPLARPEAPPTVRADGPAAPRPHVRLYVSLDKDLHRKIGAWARWHDVDVSALVAGFLAAQVADFEVRSGPGQGGAAGDGREPPNLA